MSEHSARPRIESVGTFVLTVEEPPVPVSECIVFDEYVDAPTYIEIGSGSDGTIVLSDDALCTTEDDVYTLVVLVMAGEYAVTPRAPHTDSAFTFTDDCTEEVPEYLKYVPWWSEDPQACFSPTWRHKTLFDGAEQSADEESCAGGGEFDGYSARYSGGVGYRLCDRLIPAGTTITYTPDAGTAPSVAKAFLLKNMSPATSTPRGVDDFGIVDNFDEGGILFAYWASTNAVANTCGIFTGIRNSGGPAPFWDGDGVGHFASQGVDVKSWMPDGGDGGPSGTDCDCADTTANWLWGVDIKVMPPGGGDFDAGFGSLDILSGWAWPAQGYW